MIQEASVEFHPQNDGVSRGGPCRPAEGTGSGGRAGGVDLNADQPLAPSLPVRTEGDSVPAAWVASAFSNHVAA